MNIVADYISKQEFDVVSLSANAPVREIITGALIEVNIEGSGKLEIPDLLDDIKYHI